MYITENDNPRIGFLRDKTHKLTDSPGCYIMKNKAHEIIYIGKAKNLKNRVSSYFRAGQDHLPKVWKMVQNVYDYEFIVTDSEFEALVLECSLIKQYKPKYNILLKDDKGYSYIKVTNEPYPRLQAALQKEEDGARYIGPFTSSFAVRQAVTEANRVFMLPTCSRRFPQDFRKQRPCLNSHIKLCMGVCTGRISKEEYNSMIDRAVDFIRSGSEDSVKRLTQEMNEAAENLEFERAAKLRDRINAINKAAESQKIVDEKIKDMDIIAVAQNSEMACASVLMYRSGRLFDKSDHFLGEKTDSSHMREQFLMQYYSGREKIVREILWTSLHSTLRRRQGTMLSCSFRKEAVLQSLPSLQNQMRPSLFPTRSAEQGVRSPRLRSFQKRWDLQSRLSSSNATIYPTLPQQTWSQEWSCSATADLSRNSTSVFLSKLLKSKMTTSV